MLRLDFISPKNCFVYLNLNVELVLLEFPMCSKSGHRHRVKRSDNTYIQQFAIFGQENLRIFLEYFEAQNADLLIILRFKFCYVILIKNECMSVHNRPGGIIICQTTKKEIVISIECASPSSSCVFVKWTYCIVLLLIILYPGVGLPCRRVG